MLTFGRKNCGHESSSIIYTTILNLNHLPSWHNLSTKQIFTDYKPYSVTLSVQNFLEILDRTLIPLLLVKMLVWRKV